MSAAPTTDDLGGRAVRGASATLAGQGIRIFVLLVSTVVLARILRPEDFGLYAVVASLIAFGELFRDFGLSSAASRATKISRRQKSNLFWINLLLGIVLGIIAFLSAGPIAALFRQPELTGIVEALAVTFPLSGFATQFRAEINRSLRFRALAIVDTLPVVFGLASALVYASFVGADYWVLVVQQIAAVFSGVVLAVIFGRWFPGLPSRHESIRSFLNFGLGVFGTQAIAYFTKNADNLALGFFWGPGPLGIYSRAYQVLMLPLNQIAAPMTRVAVPVLTRVADQPIRFERYLGQGQLLGGLGLGLIYGSALGLADALIPLVFGPGWESMVVVFQILAVGGIFRGLNQVTFWAFLAKDKTTSQLRFYAWSQPIIVGLMLAGLPWGPVGVAIGHSIGYFVNWLLAVGWCARATGVKAKPLLRQGFLTVAIFVAPVSLICFAATLVMVDYWLQVAMAIVGVAAYLLISWKLSAHGRTTMNLVRQGLAHFGRS
ncbi:lipopolysaccharide biosynthesis protein [Arthrobacter sp. Marseille-P9274]|uniref:lipopolysaccharide biosynthesis protein n=1 Tax=Arthrobacter sp. Marseille-P9274 TaxID=2866572 RepID=UPI0021CAC449|nr:lipopolysaccharide biosynthesis protein [Arthrobacter sp. Marseille-P9274]